MSFPNQSSSFRSWTRGSDENATAPSGFAAFRMRALQHQPQVQRSRRPLGTANPLLLNTVQKPSEDRLLLLANVALAMEAGQIAE